MGDTVRNVLFSVAAAVAVIMVIAVVGGSSPHPGQTAQTKISVKVIQMYRSVTVSPSAVACGHYAKGGDSNGSSPTGLGFPNGQCWVGAPKSTGNLPLTVTYNGPPGEVQVKGSDAVPDGSGAKWQLCGPGTSAACKGVDGKPGTDQFKLWSFAQAGQPFTQLTGQWTCDAQFNPAGFCTAIRGMSQHEGAQIIGPAWSGHPSSSYTVTITWMASPPP